MAVSLNWGFCKGAQGSVMGVQNLGAHFGSPHNKDHSIFGSKLGALISGSSHISELYPFSSIVGQY